MSLELVSDQPVQFTIVYEHGTMVQVSTTSPLIDHFLRRVKVSQSEHTWINYAHDLKVFFTVLYQPLEKIDRQSCIAFMEQQDRAGLSRLTINRNRRLAAISSLFTELNLLDPATFSRNPVAPLQRNRETRKHKKSLYRRQPDRVPDVVAEKEMLACGVRGHSYAL